MESAVPANQLTVTTDMPIWVVPESDLRFERRKELQNKALDRFQDLGLITRVENEGEEILIINDKDFFIHGGGEVVTSTGEKKTVRLNDMLDYEAKTLMNSVSFGKNRKDRTLFYIFQDKKAVLKSEDLSEARDVIYVPDTAEMAFDEKEISKNKDNYIFLFSDFSKSWQDTCPTKDLEFESGVSNFEVSTAMMAYGKGEAKRKNGVLTVIKKVGTSTSERQRISGKWFTENFGVRFVGAGRYWDSPKPLMEKFGGKLSETGLLISEDFDRPKREFKILNKGTFMWKGDMYLLGKAYADMQVKDLGNKVFAIVDNDGVVVRKFMEGVKEGAEGLVRSIKLDKQGRSRRFITQSAVSFVDDNNSEKIIVTGYNENGRRLQIFDKKLAMENLQNFKEECKVNGVQDSAFKSLNLNEQILISEVFKNIDNSDKQILWQFVEKYKEFGLKFISESQIKGELGLEFIKFAIENHDMLSTTFEKYNEILTSIDNLEEILMNSLPPNLSERDIETFKIFEGRLIESLKMRSMDLLKSTVNSIKTDCLDQLDILDETIVTINNSIKADGDMRSESVEPAVFQKSRVTRIFVGEGKKLSVTVRPFEAVDTGDKGIGQQRIQFRYTNSDGKELNLRVDSDEFGTSLDIGARGQPIVDILNKQVGSHHTHFAFEPQFSNQKTFAKMAKIFAGIFKMNIWD
jgi:hypothetical protein